MRITAGQTIDLVFKCETGREVLMIAKALSTAFKEDLPDSSFEEVVDMAFENYRYMLYGPYGGSERADEIADLVNEARSLWEREKALAAIGQR